MTYWVAVIAALLLAGGGACRAEFSVHSMVVGSDLLALTENRQLTFAADGPVLRGTISPNGKLVAFAAMAAGQTKLCLVGASGGSPKTVMAGPDDPESQPEPGSGGRQEVWTPDEKLRPAWSPDSSLFAFPAVRRLREGGDDWREETFLIVCAASGAQRAAALSPIQPADVGRVLFSPDSRRVAAEVSDAVILFDLPQGSSRALYAREDGVAEMIGWTRGGGAVAIEVHEDDKNAGEPVDGRQEIALDGRVISSTEVGGPPAELSADGKYRALVGEHNVIVEQLATGKRDKLARGEPCGFAGWAPKGNILGYTRTQTLSDDAKQRIRQLNTLWLANPERATINTMCVALDATTRYDHPTWSSDCLKIAYIARDRLYVAELARRPLRPREKLEAGATLDEQDEKAIMAENGRNIGLALMMYAADWDDELPDTNEPEERLAPYLGSNEDVFLRPGTTQSAFHYLFPARKLAEIDRPSTTPLGELDAGYNWKIVVYADGHVVCAPW